MTTPAQIASSLRHIAARIDASQQPSAAAVGQALRGVLASLEQTALPQSNTGKMMLKKMLDDAEAALESGDDKAFKGLLEKLMQNA